MRLLVAGIRPQWPLVSGRQCHGTGGSVTTYRKDIATSYCRSSESLCVSCGPFSFSSCDFLCRQVCCDGYFSQYESPPYMSSLWREVEICFLFSWNLYLFEPAVYIHCTFDYTQRNQYNSLKVAMYAELQDITSISVNASAWCNHWLHGNSRNWASCSWRIWAHPSTNVSWHCSSCWTNSRCQWNRF